MRKFCREIFKSIAFCIKVCFTASKHFFLCKCILLLLFGTLPFVTMELWKRIINLLAAGGITDLSAIWAPLVVYLAIEFVSNLLFRIDSHVQLLYYEDVIAYSNALMIDKISKMDMAYFDSSAMKDKTSLFANSFDVMVNTYDRAFGILSSALNVIVALGLVCSYNIWIGVLTVILIIPGLVYNKRYLGKKVKRQEEQATDNRKMMYFDEVFYDNDIQFELKLNNVGPYFIQKYQKLWHKIYKINRKDEAKYSVMNTLMQFINMASEIIVLIVSTVDVVQGSLGLGGIQYNLGLVTRLREQLLKCIEDVNYLVSNGVRIGQLREFIDLKPVIEQTGTLCPSHNPKIEFCNVSFHYPNTAEYVLKNCSFTILPDEKIGLVGANGAGKSTLVKLLLRFYDPDEGKIMLDGVDLKEFDVYEVRKIFGVLFQDVIRYYLTLREAIALSDYEDRYDDQRLQKAAIESGFDKVMTGWENGFDSLLGRRFHDKTPDLSGGQWQLLGLARAYFKNADWMILDEPSSAMDPISEERIFHQLYTISRTKTSLTISHRLSDNRLADNIMVLAGGQIVEKGTHDELIHAGNLYAKWFKMQAARYI